jgi:hypothetical protein
MRILLFLVCGNAGTAALLHFTQLEYVSRNQNPVFNQHASFDQANRAGSIRWL